MTRVFVHPLAGVLSAYGMGLADQNVIREQAIELKLIASALPEDFPRATPTTFTSGRHDRECQTLALREFGW